MMALWKYPALFLLPALITLSGYAAPAHAKIKVVTTLPDYAYVARFLGGDRVDVKAIVQGDQDAHFVRPKPSFAVWMNKADMFVTTGLDLELWVPTLMDKAGNGRIRQGQQGYVAAADGIPLLEIPAIKDRSQGGVHIYGNPHIQTSPLNMKQVAKNITIGLIKLDPENRARYEARLAEFGKKIDRRMFGKELVSLLGGDTLERLARSGNLVDFLKGRTYKGKPMLDTLGGWMKKALPLRGRRIVTYHKNWVYFTTLFGLDVIGEVEPKPAIPPSPLDVKRLISRMRNNNVKVILAANYFDENKIRKIADAVGGRPVIVPMSVGGIKGLDDYFSLVDYWIDGLNEAFSNQNQE
ncbi:MAG: zinc ABC transporter substrate-binding protein [Deltaproteobacteria bacterium]|nr:zinc ABC transporter substrate-binding protein [Deltaproteobacteria bacterium]